MTPSSVRWLITTSLLISLKGLTLHIVKGLTPVGCVAA
jgi:hypothetical protein